MTPAKLDLVGTAEIQERHGIPRHRVFRLLARGEWPKPLAELKAGAIFDGAAVRAAVEALNRKGG
jgi:hypothetical protein